MQKKTIYRLASLFILVALVFASSLVAHASAATFNPVADAYVYASSPTNNYGTNVSLRVDGSPIMRSYLRFTVSGLGGAAVQSAILRIYANSASTTGFSVLGLSNNSWAETSITYANAPAPGSSINSSKSFAAASWVQVDISSYIKAEGTYNLVLTTTGTQTNLASREDTAGHAPQLVITTGSGGTTTTPSKTPSQTATPSNTPTPLPTGSGSGNVLILAGDICKHNVGDFDFTPNCKKTGDLVRSLLAANPGAQVQTLGDNVNNDGGVYAYDAEYADLYGPNWGSFLSVTHALMGNHDTYPPGGDAAYFSYFGAAAGPKPGGYYSYNIGSSWHIIVLNAECSEAGAGGCGVGGVETNWLASDLAANTRPCIMAAWHQPRFTSGRHTNDPTYAPWWNLLYQYKADLVMNGHNHNYERFNPINPSEQADPNGIREFIVGTGGAPGDGYTYASHPLQPNEVVRNQVVQYGVLKMTLSASSYSWTWLPAAGYTFTDSGSANCH